MNELAMKFATTLPTTFGEGGDTFRAVPNWPRWPADLTVEEVAAVATNSRGEVHVFLRGSAPIAVFTSEGEFLRAWGSDEIARAHGITIGPDDAIYCVDDLDHTVKKFTPTGKRVWTLGVSGKPSDTGATSIDYRTIRRAGPPFYFPTNLAIAAHGELYVADGYGNARVHRFSPAGELLQSWGEPGAGPGQFHVPHGIAIAPDGIVHVADRENSRIQRFTPTGEYLDEWAGIARPCEVFITDDGTVHVAELGYRAGMWPGTSPPTPDATGGRLSIFGRDGALRARWGGGDNPCEPGDFFAPHDVWVDRAGAIYVAEVVMSAGGRRGLVAPNCHPLQKFIRVPN